MASRKWLRERAAMQRNSQWLGFCAALVELSRQLRVRLTHLRHLGVDRAARFAQFGAQIDRHASAVRGSRFGLKRVRSRRGRVGLRSRNLLLRVAWARQECAGIHGCFERQRDRERDRVQENRLQMSVLKMHKQSAMSQTCINIASRVCHAIRSASCVSTIDARNAAALSRMRSFCSRSAARSTQTCVCTFVHGESVI
jgi:hypothetical protein